MTSRYSDDQRAQYYAAWLANGKNTKGTARSLAIPETSMRTIVEQLQGAVSETIRDRHAATWERAQELAANTIIAMLPDMPHTPEGLTSVAGVARVAVAAHLDYRDGRKGTLQPGGAPPPALSFTLHIDGPVTVQRPVIDGEVL
jgi:hypothetical protein